MNIVRIPFDHYPASRFLTDHLTDPQRTRSFLPSTGLDATPDLADLAGRIHKGYSPSTRALVTRHLVDRHRQWGAPPAVFEQLELLAGPQTLAIATGQQLNLFGGPLYIIYKALSSIVIANKLKLILGIPVVPVFWMADEDHDLPEVLEVGCPGGAIRMEMPNPGSPVGRLSLPGQIGPLIDRLAAELEHPFFEGPRMDACLSELRAIYSAGAGFKDAFANLMISWFGPLGLIMMEGDAQPFKQIAADLFASSVEQAGPIRNALSIQSDRLLASGYSPQVRFDASHLFHLTSDGRRVKIRTDADAAIWDVDGTPMERGALARRLRQSPEAFSPGVLLRVLYQSELLPVLGIVGGPAEIAYLAQARCLFDALGKPFPSAIPRYSITLLDPTSARNRLRLPFDLRELAGDAHDLERRLAVSHASVDPQTLIDDWSDRTNAIRREMAAQVRRIDPTLEASTGAIQAGLERDLAKLRTRMIRSLKQKHAIDLERLRQVRARIFPCGQPQERSIAAFHVVAAMGPDWLRTLASALEHEDPRMHLLVEI